MSIDVHLGTPIPPVPPLISEDLRFTTEYDRTNPVVSDDMAPFVKGSHVYATKQVPSALALRKTRNSTLKKKMTVALSQGVAVSTTLRGKDGAKDTFLDLVPDLVHDYVEVINKERSETAEDGFEELSRSREPIPTPEQVVSRKDFTVAPLYSDPFKIISGRFLARDLGLKPPETVVWPGDGFRLSDPLPAYCLDDELWGSKAKNSIRFHAISSVPQKMYVILQHTFWGKKLQELAVLKPIGVKPDDSPGTKAAREHHKRRAETVRHWAAVLIRRIEHLLEGFGDPLWDNETKNRVYATTKRRSSAHRAKRLIEMLKTVDGIFIQRYMAVPEEKWNWEKFDLFTLKNISAIIGDEFLDGEISTEYFNIKTRYSQLKNARKLFKDLSNRKELARFLDDDLSVYEKVPRWLNDMIPVWRYTRKFSEPFNLAQVDGILSQTRAAGTPPDSVKMQSKRKFLDTVAKKSDPLTDTEKAILRAAIRTLDEQLDQSIFTGLDTKARTTITGSSCWEATQEEGGTLTAVSNIVHLGSEGKLAIVRDLFSGQETGTLAYTPSDTGSYIFWSCLDEVLKMDPREIRMAALVMISEPGKARTVTKASAALKIVLDVVNKICSWPLTKIESSTSGMGKSSHAWQSFKKSFTDSGKEVSFNPLSESVKTNSDGEKLLTTTFRDLFLSSTDYENATDAMNHQVASAISRYWMTKCGIPKVLQTIVNATCYQPRPIVFEAQGPMAMYGEPWPHESPFFSPRQVMLRKGVLMGDPLTKPVLHLVNILVRIVGENFSKPEFVDKVFGDAGGGVMLSITKVFSAKKDVANLLPRTVSTTAQDFPEEQSQSTDTALAVGHGFDPGISAMDGPAQALPPDPEALPVPAVRPLYNPLNLHVDWRVVLNVPEVSPITNRLSEPVIARQRDFLRLNDPRISHLLGARNEEYLRDQRAIEKQRLRDIHESFTFREMFARPVGAGNTATASYTRLPGSLPSNRYRGSQTSTVSEHVTCTKGFLKLFGIY